MQYKCSLPYSKQSTTNPYSLLTHTNSVHTPSLPYLRSILILSSLLCLGLKSGFFPWDFPTNIIYTFPFSLSLSLYIYISCAPHSPPNSISSTWQHDCVYLMAQWNSSMERISSYIGQTLTKTKCTQHILSENTNTNGAKTFRVFFKLQNAEGLKNTT